MSTHDLWEDGFPHGTPAGYDQGCRGGACPAHLTIGMTCRQAWSASRGDATYQRLASSGATPEQIAIELGMHLNPPKRPAPAKAPEAAQPLAESGHDRSPATHRPDDEPPKSPTTEPNGAGIREPMGHPTTPATEEAPMPTTYPSKTEIRTWLCSRGYDIASRGKIPTDMLAAYKRAHPHLASATDKAQRLGPAAVRTAADRDAHEGRSAPLADPSAKEDTPRPTWAEVTIPKEIERLRNRAARLWDELAHVEEERDRLRKDAIAAITRARFRLFAALVRTQEERDRADRAEKALTLTLQKYGTLTRELDELRDRDLTTTLNKLHASTSDTTHQLVAFDAALNWPKPTLRQRIHEWFRR